MEKEFVPHEIAKKLKGIGFKEKCMAYYLLKEEYDGCTDAEFDNFDSEHFKLEINYSYHDADGHFNDDDISNLNDCVAPLWQQVIEWFRTKHGIHINPTPYQESADRTYEITGYYMGDIIHSSGKLLCCGDGNYSSYEKAREAGILQAIKLI